MIIPEKYRKAHQEGVRRYLETGEKHLIGRRVELEALRENGTEFPVELSLSSWESQGRTLFGAIIRDISERKQFEHMREEVHRIMRHDLKSPLIGMTGLARVLLEGDNLNERQKKSAALDIGTGRKDPRLFGPVAGPLVDRKGRIRARS